MNYESSYQELPAAVTLPWAKIDSDANRRAEQAFGPNWAVTILPYMEQTALFQLANVQTYPGVNPPYDPSGNSAPAGVNMSWAAVRGTVVKPY